MPHFATRCGRVGLATFAVATCRCARLGAAGGGRVRMATPTVATCRSVRQGAAADRRAGLARSSAAHLQALAWTPPRAAMRDALNRNANKQPAGQAAIPNISGGAGKNLTFLTIHSEIAGEPLFMRVSGVPQNLTFS